MFLGSRFWLRPRFLDIQLSVSLLALTSQLVCPSKLSLTNLIVAHFLSISLSLSGFAFVCLPIIRPFVSRSPFPDSISDFLPRKRSEKAEEEEEYREILGVPGELVLSIVISIAQRDEVGDWNK